MHKLNLDGDDDFDSIEHIRIEHSEIHPKYDLETKKYDFWVIKLKWATKLYAEKVIALHQNDADVDFVLPSGTPLVTMGFGTMNEDGALPNVLQKVTLKYISNSECTKPPYKYLNNEIYDSMMCAAADGDAEEDTCEASILANGVTSLSLYDFPNNSHSIATNTIGRCWWTTYTCRNRCGKDEDSSWGYFLGCWLW